MADDVEMVKPCDICGDCGVTEAIIICCECKVAREHLYCMRVLRAEAPPFWRCEECEKNKLVSPKITDDEHRPKKVSSIMQQATSAIIDDPNNNLTASKFNFKEKRVDKGRTKYLTCDEAVKLSSGSMKLNDTRKAYSSAHGMSKALSPPRLSQQSTCLKEKATLSIKSPACERTRLKSPQEKRNFKPNLQQPVLQQSFVRKEKASVPFKRVERSNPERDIKTSKSELPPKKAVDISTHMEVPRALKKLEKTETISGTKITKIGCKRFSDVEAGRFDAGKPNLTSGLSVSEMHDPYIPSLKSYWKGCFYLPNVPQKFNEAFKAHLPSRIHYKVYETTKKMPENIYFELVPNDDIRMEIFPADRDDIGLYFFPMFKRSENVISIINFIWRNNLVMKGNVEGVELFVLSSRVLPSHSQEFDGKYFLWGVFRRPKITKTAADTLPLVANCEPCVDDDVPPGFKKICKQ
ncbi:hypothetical protein R6Q59_025355 [Mikania micrantha]